MGKQDSMKKVNDFFKPNNIRCFLLIFLCFFYTSCGYLSWYYHLSDFILGTGIDMATEVVGYVFQALGLLLFSLNIKYGWISRMNEARTARLVFASVILLDAVMLIPTTLVPALVPTLVLGYLMNLIHGVIAGFYLHRLSLTVSCEHRALVFGMGYGVASIASYLLSLLGSGNFLRSPFVLIVYMVLAFITILLIYRDEEIPSTGSHENNHMMASNLVLLAAITVILLSLVKNLGFTFPFAELETGISLELSRILYAVGLVIAGFVCDLDRKYGSVLCIASLGMPFLMIVLSDSVAPSLVTWCLNYLLFGFFAVYRVMLFSDLAGSEERLSYLSGWGLLFGRLGDAMGTCISISLQWSQMVLVLVTAVLFSITIVFFFRLYQKIYTQTVIREIGRKNMLHSFASHYSLSVRETEILEQILDGKSNSEIANDLYIVESTVKFHIRNLLKKTGCSDRASLLALYHEGHNDI